MVISSELAGAKARITILVDACQQESYRCLGDFGRIHKASLSHQQIACWARKPRTLQSFQPSQGGPVGPKAIR